MHHVDVKNNALVVLWDHNINIVLNVDRQSKHIGYLIDQKICYDIDTLFF